MRLLLAIVLSFTLAGCQAPAATSEPSAAPGSTTADPNATGEPALTTQPISTGPLPAPLLGSADEIVAAMADPTQAEQVVVSMLQLLGIGLYEPDGSLIRRGTETSDADFFVFEPSARGLVNMLRDRGDPNEQMSFRDFHAALAGAGYAGSAEDLATAYASAYTAQPEAPISLLISALGPVDVEATLPSFELWLLLLDGFVRPNGAVPAMAVAGDAIAAVAITVNRWGVARSRIQAAPTVPLSEWSAIASQLRAIVAAWHITVTAFPATVHEGHIGATGSPAQISAQLDGPAQPLVSPFGGGTVVPAATGVAGLNVGWYGNTNVDKHGSLSDEATTIGQGGRTTITYTPQEEEANGQGIERDAVGRISALFLRQELLAQLYGVWAAPYTRYIGGSKDNVAIFHIGWHEKAEAVVKIIWTDTYAGVADTIVFLGDLTEIQPDCSAEPPPDGPCSIDGSTMYIGKGTATGSRAGWAACSPGIDGAPSGTVDATFTGGVNGGTITIGAYANFKTSLSGVITAPFTVALADGSATATFGPTPLVGELCPHTSSGTITVAGLQLPTP